MSKEKIVFIISAVLLFIFVSVNLTRFVPEKKNREVYTRALSEYSNNEFSKSYRDFGKISRFSKLKPAAIFRQALCADKLEDEKTAIKKYKEVIRKYPNTTLAIRAKYLKAQQSYEAKDYKKARKEFKTLARKYAQSDYSIAAQYYLGSIEAIKSKDIKNIKRKHKSEKKTVEYFKIYLKEAPTGRFAIPAIEKWAALDIKRSNEDNLLIAKIYQENEDFKNAQKYLNYTSLNLSWPYLVKSAFKLKNYPKVKYYTEQGLKLNSLEEISINEESTQKEQNEKIYEAIDCYLKVSNDPKTAISYLLSIGGKSDANDYLLYKNCNNLPRINQAACYNTLYLKYPDGQFAADALANIFYDKVEKQQYFVANKLGKMHLSKFSSTNSAPMVMFWLAKVAERTKNYEGARSYYKSVIQKYPDSYYAYHSFLNMNRLRRYSIYNLVEKPVEFPYKNPRYEVITELAKVKDYGLINQLYSDEDFIQSWLDYLQGDYATSARVARDAMDKLEVKPERTDPRWRLVYPIHYWSDILQNSEKYYNDPVLILSIIREESYFNPEAQSYVGARGLMQLMPVSAREAAAMSGLSLPNDNLLKDPYINLRLGNIYYARLKRSLSGKDILAVLAYNGGIGSVSKWTENLNYVDADGFIEQIPYQETQNYLKKVYRSYWNYLRIYDGIRF